MNVDLSAKRLHVLDILSDELAVLHPFKESGVDLFEASDARRKGHEQNIKTSEKTSDWPHKKPQDQ